ncbi:SusC/RagA family TonB-linked outer membrane protein [Ferruginibacter sp. SUN106]|uniref:SusC/RagA family TonB-linked outer membrane protein n=1 Tax=Ferruginibacter sp. SUN106 TaxID=2978348 RepID=UPI003D35CA72
MRRFLSLFTMLMLCGVFAFAQNRVVSGKVTDKDGNPVPFASVKVKGSQVGLSADASGAYTIKVKDGDVLVISGSGYKATDVPVGTSAYLNTVLEPNSELKEVVVSSAYGVKRSLKTTSSNTQVVTSEQLNTIRNTNINEALAGKVSGIQLRGQSGAKLSSTGAIRLHGATSLGGNSGLLYVLDGTRVSADDINTDDVEDVSLLLGPAAAALFGPDGQNGAMVVTSKKAKKGASNSIGIDVNLGVRFDNVYILPNYQNSYAGGDFQDMKKYTWKAGQPIEWKALDGKYYPDYSEDVSWGPRMVGQEYIPWYAWYGGHERSFKTASLTPQPSNARDYYETQFKKFNTISFTKANDNSNVKISYTNVDVKGLVPTTWLKRNQFTTATSVDLSNRLTAGFNINVINQKSNGDFNDAYANQSSGSFNQWFHRDLDMSIVKELKDLKTPGGIQASWNHNGPDAYNAANPKDFYGPYYWQNFYTAYDQVQQLNNFTKVLGDASLTYKVSKDLKVRGTYRINELVSFNELKVSSDLTDMKFASQAAFGFTKGGYASTTNTQHDEHIELTGMYSKIIKDFNIGATAGLDIHSFNRHSNSGSTSDGFNTPNLYTLGNSKGTISSTDVRQKQKDNAIFLSANFGFRKFINADVTVRNDWFSTLPAGNNDILSKAFGLSFVASDLLKGQASWLSLAKLRASWGEIPTSIGIYQYPGSLYNQGAVQWNGNFIQGVSNAGIDPNIHGAVATEKTAGADFSFLKNRVGFSVTYTERISKDFPTNVVFSQAYGYPTLLTNAGEIDFKGLDLTFNVKPVWSKNIKWEINATYAKTIDNTVVDIDGQPQSVWKNAGAAAPSITVETATFGPTLRATEGQQWGQLYGHGIKRDASGNALLNTNGTYVYDNNANFGSVLPDFTGGFQNSFTVFGNFTVNANVDFQKGGKFYSTSTKWGNSTGVLAKSAGLNDKGIPVRDPVADGGGIHVFGVDATTLKPVDYYVNARDYLNGSNNTFDNDIFDLTYVKLREVSVGYNIPVSKLGMGKWIRKANFSVVASNAVLIYAKTKDFDPSEISGQSGEGGQFPGLRGFGVNLKLGF